MPPTDLAYAPTRTGGMMGGETDAVARMLIDEHQRGVRFRPFAAAMGITDLHLAYEVQRSYVGLQMRDRRTTPVGYKVGLTSPRMQAMCKIDRPVAGVVLGDRVHQSGVVVEARDYGRVGLEFELAVRLGRDLCGDAGRAVPGGGQFMERGRGARRMACPSCEPREPRGRYVGQWESPRPWLG